MTVNAPPSMLSRKLDTLMLLTAEERAAIDRLPVQISSLPRNRDLVRQGDRPGRCCTILEGIACWCKLTGTGERQILSLHVAGDIPDLQSLYLEEVDANLVTISPCKVALTPHDALRQLCMDFPRIAAALWRCSLIDASIFREWLLNIGGRRGMSRVAHLFCELYARLDHVGLVESDTFNLGMTQVELGEATGLSTVHVNRILQALRAQTLIALSGSRLQILDWDGLRAIGDFDPSYLHMTTPRQPADGGLVAAASAMARPS